MKNHPIAPTELAIAYSSIVGALYQLEDREQPDPQMAIAQLKGAKQALRQFAPDSLGKLAE